jgi:hypothetical protein
MMELREKSLTEVLALAALKKSRLQKNKVRVYLPAQYLPPMEVKVYRAVRVQSLYGPAEIFCRPSEKGGWELFVRFLNDTFNPALPL